MRLNNRVSLVTGANQTQGIGFAIAQQLLKEGAKLAICGRDEARLAEAQQRLGHDVLAARCDLTEPAELEVLLGTVVDRFGKIDILVANAGGEPVSPLASCDESTFDDIVSINLKATFFTVQKALPHLNNGASIILISSAAWKTGLPGASVYAAAKAGVRSFARTFATELLHRQIRVNAICPGLVDTALLERTIPDPEPRKRAVDAVLSTVPMGRVARPIEIARVAAFLASDDSSYIVGEEIAVDGGVTTLKVGDFVKRQQGAAPPNGEPNNTSPGGGRACEPSAAGGQDGREQ